MSLSLASLSSTLSSNNVSFKWDRNKVVSSFVVFVLMASDICGLKTCVKLYLLDFGNRCYCYELYSLNNTSVNFGVFLVFSNKESPGFLKLVRLEVFAPKLDQVVSLLPKVP